MLCFWHAFLWFVGHVLIHITIPANDRQPPFVILLLSVAEVLLPVEREGLSKSVLLSAIRAHVFFKVVALS